MSIHSCGLGHEGGVQKELYSAKEAETALSISHATLYRLINDGRLDARKLDGKTVITAQSIKSLVANLPALKVGGASIERLGTELEPEAV